MTQRYAGDHNARVAYARDKVRDGEALLDAMFKQQPADPYDYIESALRQLTIAQQSLVDVLEQQARVIAQKES